VPDFHLNGDSQCLPIYRYDVDGKKIDNITDWGLAQFRQYYQSEDISKEDIFHYTYSVLHNPAYRTKYALNLKREFPRLPFYADFQQWVDWGKQLMDLHLNYEQAELYALTRQEAGKKKLKSSKQPALFEVAQVKESLPHYETLLGRPSVKPKLKALKETGEIEIDEQTRLMGVPPEAWEYKLGNRSALEWVLDQYKEKKPSDPTIAANFNTYRFAEYKEEVINLLGQVCKVSVETMKIIRQMEAHELN
jgi:predicted helicase